MKKSTTYFIRSILLVVVLLKLPTLFDSSSKEFVLFYAMETSETEAEGSEEDTTEEDKFVRLAIQYTRYDLVSSVLHGYPATENMNGHIREIVPPPPKG